MKHPIRIAVALFVVLYLLLGSCNIHYTNSKAKHIRFDPTPAVTHKIYFRGLVWVGLDHYTINKYNSKDEPMQILKYSKQ